MFPQSELDNYKLQVELLQEKLQRSEISRQQLEHKLDKILQKRDEHDKLVQSKARQKYQQFLEEQQRRNERNRQLVQMLERIEQQTEAMNARSERLKMMKLQYEMYFAKLVHSQTRRCIQNSVSPVTPMMATTSGQSIVQNMKPTDLQTVMEGYNNVTNVETPAPFMSNSCESYATTVNMEKEQYLRSQMENKPLGIMEMPTLANIARIERNDCRDFRNLNVEPKMESQQSNQYQAKLITNNAVLSNNNNNNKEVVPNNSVVSSSINSSSSLFSVSNLLPYNKQLAEFKEPSNLSTTTSSTFEEIPNVSMRPQIPQFLREIPNSTTTTRKSNNVTNSSDTRQVNENFEPLQKQIQLTNGTNFTNANQTVINATSVLQTANQNSISQEKGKEVVNPLDKAVNEFTPQNVPQLLLKPSTFSELEPLKTRNESSPTFSSKTNFINSQPQTIEQPEIINDSLAPAIEELNSSKTPVSIENIENAIYGELLSTLETEDVRKGENTNVVPKLLENLVTQPENIETDNIPLEEPTLKQNIEADNFANDTTPAAGNESQQTTNTQNYDQTAAYDDYNNVSQPDQSANNVNDYNIYENVDSTAVDENQQQQQYDYSNYDPTQYSYPGYIYDETTGEYKPDPNAPAEQYATDQQYTTEGYDQQYQQQEIYDYNQTYAQDPTASSTTVENTAYNNYDTSQQENPVADINAEQQQEIAREPEAIVQQPEITPEEIPQPSTKVTKPTSILSTVDKNDNQKKRKRVNFVESSETDESAVVNKGSASATKPNAAASSESDFDFSSSTEAEAKTS